MKIQNNVSVYRGVELADGVFVGPSAVFTNDLRPRARSGVAGAADQSRRGASIGANATVVCGIEIGEHAMVGAGAVVTAPVRPHQLVAGNPARHQAWVCGCGEILARTGPRPSFDAQLASDDASGPGADGDSSERITLVKVVIGAAEEEAVLGVLRSGMLAGGIRVTELEQAFAGRTRRRMRWP